MADSTFTFRVDEELKEAFAAVAEQDERTAAQLLRVLMRQAVQRHQDATGHDRWFRAEVEQAVTEADDPEVQRVAHDQVRSSWQQQKEDLERRAAGRTA